MTGEFPNVTRASFDWMNTGEHVPQEKIGFISSLDSLESLKISIDTPYPYGSKSKSRTRFPLEIFGQAQVVSTIRSLALTQTESSLIDLRRPMLDVAEITKIRDACPGLSEFTLDIDRDAEIGWPNETFATLQQMHNLTDLHLRLEIGADLHAGEQGEYYFNDEGISGDSALREPRMNKSVAESLFADLQAGKVGKPLALVSFEVGDYSEGGYVGPLYYPSWEEGRARKFICSEQDTSKICRVLGERDIYEDLPHDEL